MGFNVLIVDDSAVSRGMVRKVLGMTQLSLGEVLDAPDGIAGLAMMRDRWVDLVIADLNMPVMGGEEMIGSMRADPLLQRIPVVVVSSTVGPELRESLLHQGVRECLRKPFEPRELRQVMEKVLIGSLP